MDAINLSKGSTPIKAATFGYEFEQNGAAPVTTAAVFNTAPINTIYINEIAASLASNQITLPAGKYSFSTQVNSYYTNRNNIRLWNITDNEAISYGSSGISKSGGFASASSTIFSTFELAQEATIELQVYTHQSSTFGFGLSSLNGVVTAAYKLNFLKLS